jgi:hypothetical protein
VTDNLDLGRPDTIEIIFNRQVRSTTESELKTKVVSRGTEVTVNAFYKHSRIKHYLKDQRAPRWKRSSTHPVTWGRQRRVHNLDELQARVLHTERAGQACVLANPVFERIAHPSVTADGRRATAMRFGDSRVQALAGALAVTLCAVTGLTNRSLRALMTGLLGAPYGMTRACYDLARLESGWLPVWLPEGPGQRALSVRNRVPSPLDLQGFQAGIMLVTPYDVWQCKRSKIKFKDHNTALSCGNVELRRFELLTSCLP